MSGPHAFAVHIRRLRQRRHPRPPHPRPASMTLANAPLSGTGCKSYSSILISEKQKYFCWKGLDRANQLDPARQFRFYAQAIPASSGQKKTRRDGSRRVPTFVTRWSRAESAPMPGSNQPSGRSQRGDSAWCKTLDHLLSLLMEVLV
jgi:hypothetical protein